MFYLSLPEDLSKYDDEDVEFFSMVSPSINREMEYDSDNGRYITLYAFTDKKEFADEFESIHDMDLFVRIKKKVSQSEYNEISSELGKYKLESTKFDTHYPMSREMGVDHLLLTELEFDVLSDDINFDVEQMLFENVSVEYAIFKNNYIKALDLLLYCTYNKMIYSEDSDCYSSNFSYGVTAEGYPRFQVYLQQDILKLYVKFFALLLRKEK